MKLAMIFLTLLFVNSAMAATPFTWSRESINAIFNSPKVWGKIAGEVESIVLMEKTGNTSKYAVTTTENIKIIDRSGVTTGFRAVACTVLVDVLKDIDELGGTSTIEVSNVDFSACPETSLN